MKNISFFSNCLLIVGRQNFKLLFILILFCTTLNTVAANYLEVADVESCEPPSCSLLTNGDFEAGSFPSGGAEFAFAGGNAVDFGDETPDSWTQATASGGNYWVESSAALSGNKYIYQFSSGTTIGGSDACSEYDLPNLEPNTCYEICVYAADANADGFSSGMAIEVEENGGAYFDYGNFEVADNPAWNDNALSTIPWTQYCYSFTTQATTSYGRFWLSATAEVGTASTSRIVLDDVCMGVCEIAPCLSECTQNTTTYTMDWSQIGWVNPANITANFPYNQTFTDIEGSGVDMTVTVHKQPSLNSSGNEFANPNCSQCVFGNEVTSYVPSGEILRLFKKNNNEIDSISISFSEPILLDNFIMGGERSPGGGTFGVSQVTFWDGPNGTGNKVGANVCNWVNVSADAEISVENALSTTVPINVLTGQTSATVPVQMGNQIMTYHDGSFYGFGTQNVRPWTVLNMDSVYVQSIKWYTYGSSTINPSTAKDNLVLSGNLSAYISSFNFMKCDEACEPNKCGRVTITRN